MPASASGPRNARGQVAAFQQRPQHPRDQARRPRLQAGQQPGPDRVGPGRVPRAGGVADHRAPARGARRGRRPPGPGRRPWGRRSGRGRRPGRPGRRGRRRGRRPVTSTGSSSPSRPSQAALTRPPPVPSRSGSCTTSTPGRPARWAISWSAPWWALTTTRVAPAAGGPRRPGRPAAARPGPAAAWARPGSAASAASRPRGQAEPDHRGGASGAIQPHPGPSPSRSSSPSSAAVPSAEAGSGSSTSTGRSSPVQPAGGGWVEQQRPPGPGLVDRGPQGHRGRQPRPHGLQAGRARPGSASGPGHPPGRNPGSPAGAPARPLAQVGHDRPPEPGQEPGPGGHRVGIRRAQVGQGGPGTSRARRRAARRPGPGCRIAQQEEHARQLRLGPPAGVVRNQSSGTW